MITFQERVKGWHLKTNITHIMASKINCFMSHIKIHLLRNTYGQISMKTVTIKTALKLISVKGFLYRTTVLPCRRDLYFNSYALWHHYAEKTWKEEARESPGIISSYSQPFWIGNLFYCLFLASTYHILFKSR